ncbi:addiction module protein [Flavivirga abyssicola]|uniref:addiction module protein n=1 Tax=Flavivirga abyssicola TaxID=3063533 RepID=UPI0026E08843|nr:addiction module protein [Flavivirga sp. MEBiC07777]WVK15162.1 addiction module protein [Flavivirga sp. MEBiC07777]
MDLQAEKIELIKLLLETQQESLIKKIKTLLKDESENKTFELPESQKEELDRRLSRMEKGETKFYTWEQVEQKLKQAL